MRLKFFLRASSGLLTALLACGCGDGSSTPPPPSFSVTLSPSLQQTIDQGQTVNIKAAVADDSSGKGVTWSLTGPGWLSNQTATSVTYNAVSGGGTVQKVTVGATSVADPAMTSSLSIVVNLQPIITTVSLPNGAAGTVYSQTLTESGGTPPFTWSMIAGALPNGLNFDKSSGAMTGTPSEGGTWYFMPQLTDAAGFSVNGIIVNGTPGYPLDVVISANIPSGNPIPFIGQPLVPASISPGGAGFNLTVSGAGFVPGATVDFNGTALATTFVSNVQLTAAVPGSDIASAGTAFITVVNPTPGGGRSNVAYFPVAAPEASVNFSTLGPYPLTGNLGVADLNGDGKLDLAVANSDKVTILLGNGGGLFTQAPKSPIALPASPFGILPPGATSVLVGDFNNGGKLGLAILEPTNNIAAILLGNGDGTLTPSTASAYTQGCPSAFAAADFNRDGNLDLVAMNTCGVSLAFLQGYGDGAFTYQSAVPTPAPGEPNSVAVGDFNGDGRLDLVYTSYDGDTRVSIMLGNGDGTFTQASSSPITIPQNIPASVIVGDFNGDGKMDLAITTAPSLNGNSLTGSVYIFLGNGDGSFTAAQRSPISVGIEPMSIVMGDFNGDGKVDLVIANNLSNTLTLVLGNGDGTFSSASGSPIAVGRGPSIAIGDFNGSGRLGLVVSNAYDQTISVLVQK